MSQFIFNAAEVEPSDDFEILPVGDYKAVITESEFKETNSNPQNKYLSLKLQILEGKHKNRTLFDNLNLIRANNTEKDQTTIRIAQQRLSAICRATGRMQIKDSSELHNKPILISVGIQAATAKYAESNTIKSYNAINGGNSLPEEPAKEPEEQGGAMPWES